MFEHVPFVEFRGNHGLLRRVSAGDPTAEAVLIKHVYADLRRLAASFLRGERTDHTLQPTALLNEAYLRLIGGRSLCVEDRSHFFRLAAAVMRRILVDHARVKKAEKRGGGDMTISLNDMVVALPVQSGMILFLDEALRRLHVVDKRVAEMRLFGGLSEEEIASAASISAILGSPFQINSTSPGLQYSVGHSIVA